MADGITTRVQKEVGMLHKELELVRAEITSANEQLRKEFENRIEAISCDNQKMFSQIMLKLEPSQSGGLEGSGSSGPTALNQNVVVGIPAAVKEASQTKTETLDLTGLRTFTKYSKLECPRFDGVDFRGWLLKIEQFFEADQTKESDKLRTVMMHLDGKALQWHQRYMKNYGALSEMNWDHYITEMRIRFSENEFSNPMLELVSLKQSSTVEEFYEDFESLLNLLQLPDDYALSVFIGNLKPDISKSLRLFHPKTLTYALTLAKQIESLMFSPPRKPYTPYQRPLNTITTTPSLPILPKSSLPPLLPTPKGP